MKICSNRRLKIIKSQWKRISLNWELKKIQFQILINQLKIKRAAWMIAHLRNSQNYKGSWELTLSWSLRLTSLRVLLILYHLVIDILKTRIEWPKSSRRSRIVRSKDKKWIGWSTKRTKILIEPPWKLVANWRTLLTWTRRKSTKLKWRQINRKISNRALILKSKFNSWTDGNSIRGRRSLRPWSGGIAWPWIKTTPDTKSPYAHT